MKHTPEPWWACCGGEGGYSHFIFDRNERAICSLCSNDPDDKRDTFSPLEIVLTVPERQANAERIVACVNFCEGVETEGLKDFNLIKLWGDNIVLKATLEQIAEGSFKAYGFASRDLANNVLSQLFGKEIKT